MRDFCDEQSAGAPVGPQTRSRLLRESLTGCPTGVPRFEPSPDRESQANVRPNPRFPARDGLTVCPPQACMGCPLWSSEG